MTDADKGRHESRRTWLVLALILALAALVRVLSFRGYTTYDAAEYTRLAHMIISGQFRVGMLWFFHVFPVRVGLFAPVALAFKLGGVNEVTLTAYPFLLSMLSVPIAFFVARAMFGTGAGLAAACLMALLPIDARHASQLLPDLPAAFWMNAGVLLVFAGSRQEAVTRKGALGALAGLALFASWLCKETVLFLLPFVGAYLLWLAIKGRRNVTLLVATVAVAGLLVGFEGWVYHRYTGDFLYRYHTLIDNAGAGADRTMPILTASNAGRVVAHRATVVLHEVLLAPFFAFIPLAALLACAYAVFLRSRRFLLPGLWFGWLLLLFGFGSASLRGYFPLDMAVTRHQYPLLFPAVLLVAGLAGSLFSPREPNEPEKQHRRRLLWGVLMSVCLAGMSLAMVAWGIGTGMGRRCRASRNISRILKPTDRLYTDPHTAIALEFFWKFPAADSTHSFEGMALSQLPSGVYVLFNRNELDRIGGNTTFVPPEFLRSVPATWQKIREKDNATLYWVPPPPLPN
jgi:4-amino-4-deoxy-L-arabinose transferase-like glycosyltransferase